MRHTLITAAVLAALAAPAFAQSSQEEIASALVGNTFQGGMGGGAYTGYFDAEGMYHDETGSGPYTVTEDGVCYPDTAYGCYQAEIDGDSLEWFQDGESQGSGKIIEGNPMNFGETET